jgi:hypothetical protein
LFYPHQDFVRCFELKRNNAITAGRNSVHPKGSPIIHSTNWGFRAPPTSLKSGGFWPPITFPDSFVVFFLGGKGLSAASLHVGVGHFLAIPRRLNFTLPFF